MSNIAILVDRLAKEYQIGQLSRSHDTLRDSIVDAVASPFLKVASLFGRNGRNGSESANACTIWALKDVSFEVQRGEVIGIIGRNGAGKSTLLKILCRITQPTHGCVEIRGRVGSLLEVGTGFHHELTGRDNVFLSGAILGMRKHEIARKFDAIVDFSGVEKFIDTPVKHYSTGMYMRLAFAVAAHLDPDILIVDEVLAVGDLSFQKKCLGRMENVAKDGRTVVFVSHNMSAITRLCSEAILLDQGQVAFRGSVGKVVDLYLNSGVEQRSERFWRAEELPDTCGPFRPISVRICDDRGSVIERVRASRPFSIEISYELSEPLSNLGVQIKLYTAQGDLLFISSDVDQPANHERHYTRQIGRCISRCHIPGNLLNQGTYLVGISVAVPNVHWYFWDQHAVSFTVDETDSTGNQWVLDREGFFRPAFHWDIDSLH
jgi:lipopolysaccharide transport system ATP-binding protein